MPRRGFARCAKRAQLGDRPSSEVEIFAVQPTGAGTTLLEIPVYRGKLKKIAQAPVPEKPTAKQLAPSDLRLFQDINGSN